MKEPTLPSKAPVLLSVVGAGLLAVFLSHLDAFDFLYEISREYEAYEVDEIILACLFGLVVGSVTFAITMRRSLIETQTAYRKLVHAYDQLRLAQDDPQTDPNPMDQISK